MEHGERQLADCSGQPRDKTPRDCARDRRDRQAEIRETIHIAHSSFIIWHFTQMFQLVLSVSFQ
jgi:hypothetical protein